MLPRTLESQVYLNGISHVTSCSKRLLTKEKNHELEQLDVKMNFLHNNLDEQITYISQRDLRFWVSGIKYEN